MVWGIIRIIWADEDNSSGNIWMVLVALLQNQKMTRMRMDEQWR